MLRNRIYLEYPRDILKDFRLTDLKAFGEKQIFKHESTSHMNSNNKQQSGSSHERASLNNTFSTPQIFIVNALFFVDKDASHKKMSKRKKNEYRKWF
jgi:hypothetical protein